MEYIILAFGGGMVVTALVDRMHYRKQIGDAYEAGAIDGAMAVMQVLTKKDPTIMSKIENEILESNKGKVL